MARIFSFRGKSVEELQAMNIDSFAKLLKARPRRALKRMGVQFKELTVKVEKEKKAGSGKIIKTSVREAVIIPSWLGLRFGVFNGKEFRAMTIVPEMLGHRLGEYSYTTKNVQHSAPGIRATRGSKFLAVK